MTTPASTDGSRGGRNQERTRVQLRDMDRLLEEMLALPIGDRPRRTLEDLDAPPEPEPQASSQVTITRHPSGSQSDRLDSFLATSERTDAGTGVAPPDQQPHLHLAGQTDALEHDPRVHVLSMEREELAGNAVLGEEDRRAELSPRELMETIGLSEAEARKLAPSAATPSAFLWILIGINALYDRLADLLWPLGGLLKWIGTRYVLGIAGVAMLLAAAAWLWIGRFGWTW